MLELALLQHERVDRLDTGHVRRIPKRRLAEVEESEEAAVDREGRAQANLAPHVQKGGDSALQLEAVAVEAELCLLAVDEATNHVAILP